MKRVLQVFMGVLLLTLLSQPLLAEEKKRIAVLPFDTNQITPWWQGGFNPGRTVSNYIENQLAKLGKYEVIDRKYLAQVMQEHNLSVSGEVDPTTAIEVGRLLGVDYLIVGAVEEFQMTGRSSGSVGVPIPGPIPSIGLGSSKKEVRVTVTGKAINTTTSQVTSPITVQAVKKAGGSVLDLGVVSTESEEFADSALGKALLQVASDFVGEMEKSKWEEVKVREKMTGVVINIEESQVVINRGQKDRIRKGMLFKVYRDKVITDPTTGKVLTIKKPVGEIKIIDVQDEVSIGEVVKIESGMQIVVKDEVKEE